MADEKALMQDAVQYGWWTRLHFALWLACGFWVRPRVLWLARSLALF